MPSSSAASFFTPAGRCERAADRLPLRPLHVLVQRRRGQRRARARWRRAARSPRASITGPAHSTTARSIVFSSSRTLPGQSWPCRAASAAVVDAVRRACPCAGACLRRKCSTSAGMSSRRSRSGGIVDGDHVQPVVEVLLELALRHHLPQVAVGGGDHAHVHLLACARRRAARTRAPAARAAACACRAPASGADLVQEDGAAVGQREAALLVGGGAGEGAAHVAEQLRLQQRLGDGRAVHLDQGHLALRAAVVDGARHQLLARARLAGDEHRAAATAPPARRAR